MGHYGTSLKIICASRILIPAFYAPINPIFTFSEQALTRLLLQIPTSDEKELNHE